MPAVVKCSQFSMWHLGSVKPHWPVHPGNERTVGKHLRVRGNTVEMGWDGIQRRSFHKQASKTKNVPLLLNSIRTEQPFSFNWTPQTLRRDELEWFKTNTTLYQLLFLICLKGQQYLKVPWLITAAHLYLTGSPFQSWFVVRTIRQFCTRNIAFYLYITTSPKWSQSLRKKWNGESALQEARICLLCSVLWPTLYLPSHFDP